MYKIQLVAHKYKILALLVLVIYLFPNIFFPSKAKYLVHDNMDSNVVWYKNLTESGKIFAGNYEKIERSLGGIDRGCFLTEFNVNIWLYRLFNPLTAYNINIILMHLFAFFSFLVFLRNIYLKKNMKIIVQWFPCCSRVYPFGLQED